MDCGGPSNPPVTFHKMPTADRDATPYTKDEPALSISDTSRLSRSPRHEKKHAPATAMAADAGDLATLLNPRNSMYTTAVRTTATLHKTATRISPGRQLRRDAHVEIAIAAIDTNTAEKKLTWVFESEELIYLARLDMTAERIRPRRCVVRNLEPET